MRNNGPLSFGIVAHGGVGAPKTVSPGCRAACRAGYEKLREGASALDAVVETVRLLEDDGRFNAGRGSTLRLDGKTIEMDAAAMDSDGRLGAVMAIRDVQNPVLVARRVMETPHVALAGEGAILFARTNDFPPSGPPSPAARRRYQRLRKSFSQGRLTEGDSRWDGRKLQDLWNFPSPRPDASATDTVGAVALDRAGRFASALSTGGASPMLLGRVGDVPLIGCGFYAGTAGAVAVTGIGEEIVRKMLSRTVYDRIVQGIPLDQACREGLDLFPGDVPVGIIAITRTACVHRANRAMPASRMVFQTPL